MCLNPVYHQNYVRNRCSVTPEVGGNFWMGQELDYVCWRCSKGVTRCGEATFIIVFFGANGEAGTKCPSQVKVLLSERGMRRILLFISTADVYKTRLAQLVGVSDRPTDLERQEATKAPSVVTGNPHSSATEQLRSGSLKKTFPKEHQRSCREGRWRLFCGLFQKDESQLLVCVPHYKPLPLSPQHESIKGPNPAPPQATGIFTWI